ncbi:hypothetical protein G9A89_016323 [Geosiphon pyriformis]|nr:hypothetical protein G9A89_016323 [Geosiphon pyriformis]
MPLNYVDDNAFSDVIVNIGMEKLSLVVDNLPNDKAARLSGMPNEFWKHCGGEILACFLNLLNLCLSMGAVLNLLLPDKIRDIHYNKHTRAKKRPKTSSNIWCSPTETTQQNNFKVATTPDTTTLEYYQSIYTHCKQRFNIPDGIEVVKKSVYQYIENRINNYLFGNYNISEVRSNLYNNLVHYSQLETEDLNSETLATYFQELNFNIIKYCKETYLVQSQYSIDFESETETSNKGKQKLKQYSKTTPNTSILPKTTAKYLQTPEQGTTENRSEHSETAANEENDSEISEEKSIDTFKTAFLKQFTDNNTLITLRNHFCNIKQEPFESVMTYIGKFNKLLRQIHQLETNDYYSDAQILDQFITGLKDKLIKKVCPHVPEDLNSAIQHAKRYEMAIEEANYTKLVNLAIEETSSAAEEKID